MKYLIGIGAFTVLIIVFIYGIFAWGLVTYFYYYWFLLPVFTNLPNITIVEAIGISFFISLFKNMSTKSNNENKNSTEIITPFLTPLIALFFGWLYHLLLLV